MSPITIAISVLPQSPGGTLKAAVSYNVTIGASSDAAIKMIVGQITKPGVPPTMFGKLDVNLLQVVWTPTEAGEYTLWASASDALGRALTHPAFTVHVA